MIAELRTLSRHVVVYGLGFLLARAVGFLLVPLYTRFLTPADYGVIELLDLTGFFLGTFIALGMEPALMKYYHAYDDQKDRDRVLSTSVIFSAISGVILIAAVLPFSSLLSSWVLGSASYSWLFLLSFVTLPIAALLKLEKTTLRVQNRSALFTVISLVHTAVAILLNIYFVAVLKQGPVGVLYSTLISSTIFTVYLTWRIFRESGSRLDSSKMYPMLKYGVYFVPAGLASFVLHWADRYFLRAYDTIEAVGLYALGYKISMIVVLLVAVPFDQIWHSYMFEIQKKPNAREVYAKVSTYFLTVLTAVALGIAVLGREIVVIMAAPAYLAAYTVLPVLVAAMIFFCAETVFQVGLLVQGQSNRLSWARWIGAGANIVLNLALIPPFGMMGAAVATLLSFALADIIVLRWAQQVYHVPFEFRRLAQMTALAAATFAVSAIVPSTSLVLDVAIKTAIWTLFPILLFVTGFLTAEEKAQLRQGLAGLQRFAMARRTGADTITS